MTHSSIWGIDWFVLTWDLFSLQFSFHLSVQVHDGECFWNSSSYFYWQQRLLESFYEVIYREERHFADEDLSQFEEENDDVDNDGGIVNEDEDFVIEEVENDDPSRDIDAEPDESDDKPLVTQNIPRQQKFGSQSGVTNSENFEKVLEQTSAEYVWSNKAGEHEEWQTQKPTSNTNLKRAGRRKRCCLLQFGAWWSPMMCYWRWWIIPTSR